MRFSLATVSRARTGTGHGGATFVLDTQQQVSYEVQRVGIPDAGNDGTGIGIALLDTGIDFNHPDLKPAANTTATSYNAISPGSSCQDDGGHGTHVAGLMAAQNNAIGIVGVAPGATLYCVKVLSSAITGTDAQIMAGLDWVLQNYSRVTPRIRIVNMSLGRLLGADETLSNSALRPLFDALYARGIVVVAAAGNNPNYEVSQMVPAGFPSVFSVASTTAANGIRTCYLLGTDLPAVKADTASGFTTDGASVTISAPGEERSDIVQLGSAGCVGLEYGTLSTSLGTG
ncbi:MAG: S8 family serine peptidase [Bryobacteraceae bacterium]